jgi:predicted nucleic acid-binding protein
LKAYIDTSVLARAYCAEPGSRRAQKTLQDCEPAISSLTRLEFSSAVAKKVRAGEFTTAEATGIVSEFHAHIRDGVFELLPMFESHYALANEWVDSFTTALRALDALHMALTHSSGAMLITADNAQAKAAKILRVPAERI